MRRRKKTGEPPSNLRAVLVPTIRVHRKDHDGPIVINEADFDPEVHTKAADQTAEPKPAKRRKKKPEASNRRLFRRSEKLFQASAPADDAGEVLEFCDEVAYDGGAFGEIVDLPTIWPDD